MQIDRFDAKILSELAQEGRLTAVELSSRVGLSASACTRRLQALESGGVIAGYRAVLDEAALGFGVTAFIEVSLERQSDEALKAFETAVAESPHVLACHLMSGSSDYLIEMIVRDLADFERVHAAFLARLPGVSRIESKFSLRKVVDRPLIPASRQV